MKFKPSAAPLGMNYSTLHGLTHREVCAASGISASTLICRYVDVRGPAGSLTGFIEPEHFDAVCKSLGVEE